MNSGYFRRLARYNAWANRRLYEACGKLSAADLAAKRAAFFGSISGTLNHILVADRIWLGRFEGRAAGIDHLDQILYEDFAELRAQRHATDGVITDWVASLADAYFLRDVDYRGSRGHWRHPLWWVFAHLFNHQTHHRGQTTIYLRMKGVVPPPEPFQ